MKTNKSENITLLTEFEETIGDVNAHEYIHGKFDYSISPDFCGFPSRVPNKKNPDKVEFKIDKQLDLNSCYKLRYNSGHTIDIRIEKFVSNIFYAEVIIKTK